MAHASPIERRLAHHHREYNHHRCRYHWGFPLVSTHLNYSNHLHPNQVIVHSMRFQVLPPSGDLIHVLFPKNRVISLHLNLLNCPIDSNLLQMIVDTQKSIPDCELKLPFLYSSRLRLSPNSYSQREHSLHRLLPLYCVVSQSYQMRP